MRRPDPATLKEYNELYMQNVKTEGYFLDVHQIVPCPACCEPKWAVWYIAAGIAPGDERPNLDKQMSTPSTCSNCGRTFKGIVNRTQNGVNVEFVQTGGEAIADYLPKIRQAR